MGVNPTDIQLQLELSTGTFTDVWDDVMTNKRVQARYGIFDQGPLDRVASAGRMEFNLNNGENNSSGTVGYYSPGHSAVRTGFHKGILTRLRIDYGGTAWYKWIGTINRITPEPGQYGKRMTKVEAKDWFADAVTIKPEGISVQTNKRGDELLTTLFDVIKKAPDVRTIDTGKSTFNYALDDIRDRSTPIKTALQNIALSEFGFIYPTGGTVAGTVAMPFRFENRHAKVTGTAVSCSLSENEWTAMEVVDDMRYVCNIINTTSYPREVDSTADKVLWQLQGDAQPIVPGETLIITGTYTDPDNRDVTIAGVDIVTPVSGTDYEFSSTSGGSGGIEDDLGVVTTIGGNSIKWELTNNGSIIGYITKLQVRGKRVLIYQPALTVSEDDARTEDIPLDMFLRYQDNVGEVKSFSDITLSRYKDFDSALRVRSVSFIANKSADLMRAFLMCEPGDRIDLVDATTGVDGEFFITGVDFRISEGDIIECTWYLAQASDVAYWILGSSGLGTSTALAF